MKIIILIVFSGLIYGQGAIGDFLDKLPDYLLEMKRQDAEAEYETYLYKQKIIEKNLMLGIKNNLRSIIRDMENHKDSISGENNRKKGYENRQEYFRTKDKLDEYISGLKYLKERMGYLIENNQIEIMEMSY